MDLKLRDWILRDYNVPKSEGIQLITILVLTILISCLAVGEILVDLKATSLPLILSLLGCNLILLIWVKYFGKSKIIGHAQLLILYIMFQVSFFMLPNTFHVFMYWMPSIPLLALIFGNVRSSHIWLAIILITLWIDSSYGIQQNGKEYSATIPYIPYSFAASFFTLTLVVCFLLLYNLLGRSYSRLRSKNREVIELISQLKTMNGSLESIVKERTQDIEERNERLKRYAFMNSHLVRAPLANILGAVQHLQDENDRKKSKELMELLMVSASNLDDVIKEVGKSLAEKE
ncbi:hypothetical protein [Ekhidna sp.]|uniref:hypothetical protein n=1 Tax=Ekhidna sp. TaxID=2608089 RepID=UPI003296A29F